MIGGSRLTARLGCPINAGVVETWPRPAQAILETDLLDLPMARDDTVFLRRRQFAARYAATEGFEPLHEVPPLRHRALGL